MIIRKATKKDFNELFMIIKEEYGKPPYKERWAKPNAFKTLDYYSKRGKIYVAEIDGKVIGLLVIHLDVYNTGAQMDIKELAVKSKFHGKGIGKALIKKAEEVARKNKANMIYLTTSLDAPAFHFYKKMGYIPSKKTVFFRKFLK